MSKVATVAEELVKAGGGNRSVLGPSGDSGEQPKVLAHVSVRPLGSLPGAARRPRVRDFCVFAPPTHAARSPRVRDFLGFEL